MARAQIGVGAGKSRIDSVRWKASKKGLGTDVVLTGDKKLDRALRRLAVDMQRQIVARALERAAKPIERRANQLAPKAEDERDQPAEQRGKHLRGSIYVRGPTKSQLAKASRPIKVSIAVGTRATLGLWRKMGGFSSLRGKGFYPTQMELGFRLPDGRHFPAQPYLRPALYENSATAKELARRHIWRGIQRSARRSGANR